MKIIINGFHHHKQIEMLREVFARVKAEKVAIISQTRYLPYFRDFPVPVAVFTWEDVYRDNRLPTLDPYRCRPLDAGLLDEFAAVEIDVYTMLYRQEFHSVLDFEKRQSVYRRQLYFWYNYVAQNGFDLYLTSNIPHEIYDYVIYRVMEKLGKRSVIFYQIQVFNTIFTMDNLLFESAALEKAFRPLRDLERPLSPEGDEEIPENIRTELAKRHLDRLAKPFYIDRKLVPPRERLPRRPVTTRRVWNHALYRLRKINFTRQRAAARARQLAVYRRAAQAPDFTKRYVYLPLHYQPECTSCPMGGRYMDQAVIVSMLSSCCRGDVLIYVKEHPKQTAIQRSADFYREIASYPNVRLVPLDTDTETLIKHSLAVATVTGTPGWEALFLKKPVFLFGSIFYQYFPYVYRIRDYDDLLAAYRDVLSLRPFELERVVAGLKLLGRFTLQGIIDPMFENEGGLGTAESLPAIKRFLLEKLGAGT